MREPSAPQREPGADCPFPLFCLLAAFFAARYAKTVGIAVDARRRNRSVAAKQANVARLQDYKARLVVFPRGSNQKPRGGDAAPEDTASATQISGINTIAKPDATPEFASIEEARAAGSAYKSLRIVRLSLLGGRLCLFGLHVAIAMFPPICTLLTVCLCLLCQLCRPLPPNQPQLCCNRTAPRPSWWAHAGRPPRLTTKRIFARLVAAAVAAAQVVEELLQQMGAHC